MMVLLYLNGKIMAEMKWNDTEENCNAFNVYSKLKHNILEIFGKLGHAPDLRKTLQ